MQHHVDSLRYLPLSAALLIFSAFTARAQAADQRFERLTAQQGLSFNEVTCIMQDSRGFMWFGTGGGGLNRYDGYSFTEFKSDPFDSMSLGSGWVNTLTEDRHGDIWINASANLARFDRVTGTITRCLPGRWVTSSYEDTSSNVSQKGMWFTSYGQGIYHFERDSGRFTGYHHNPGDDTSISSDSAFCVFADSKGTLWIGTTRGLNSFDTSRRGLTRYGSGPQVEVYALCQVRDGSDEVLWIGAEDGLYAYTPSIKSFVHYRIPFARFPHDNSVHTLYGDRQGRLWVGTLGGIARFDRAIRRFTGYQNGIGVNIWGFVNTAWSLCEDKTGTLWEVTHWGALRRFDELKTSWVQVPIAADHEVLFHALCLDNSGTMWCGTVDDAVLKLDPARKPFTLYTKVPGDPSSLSSATVTGICEDESGDVWVGTLLGLNVLDHRSGKFTHYRHDDANPHSLSHDVVRSVIENRGGILWLGTIGGGLDSFDKTGNSFIHHQYDPRDTLTIASNEVESLCQSRDGNLWVGSYGTITEYSPASRSFRRHVPDPARSHEGSDDRAILEDRAGLLWIANPGGGLSSYNRLDGTWKHYLSEILQNGKGILGARALCEDHQGTLWVGTDQTLCRFEKETGTYTQFGVKEGLANGFVDAILEDGTGHLWVCTAGGLSKFDLDHESFRNFDAADGFDIGASRLPTGYRNRRGEMFFGGSNGFARFHPDSIRDNPFVPPIVLTGFNTFEKPVQLDSVISEKKKLELSYRDNVISFEFAALNFTSTGKNQYAYKLESFDTGWVYCGTRRRATYTNLDGGHYIFRVKGSNNDGIWNEPGVSIAVIIIPPWWATWWFKTLFLVTVLVSVGGTVRYVEMRKLKRKIDLLEQEHMMHRERIRISQDMHDDVGSSLSEIAILSELAKTKPDEASKHVQEISERAAEVIESLGEIVWAMNPVNDTLDNLVARIRRHAVKYMNMANVQCTFSTPDGVPAHHIAGEVRRNLFLVVKEALHNVVKHSLASRVYLNVTLADNKMTIVIEDDGRGFSVEDRLRSGNGLASMSKRMADIGGMFTLRSDPTYGTVIAIGIAVPH
jgi:ligand-binding sensor domain-containing protein/signal transduction histidine kinase